MTEYTTRRIAIPPVLAIEDGQLVIKFIDGDLTLIASVGDGRWFFSQVIDKLVNPALANSAAVRQLHDAQALAGYSMIKMYWDPLDGQIKSESEGIAPAERVRLAPTDEDGDRVFASPND